MNEENKKKLMDANNNDPVFVTGVLYGIMFGIEMVMDEKLPVSDKKNIIVDLINDTISSCGMKMGEMFKLIKENNRVPDLMKVLELKRETNKKLGLNQKLREAIDGILKCEKEGANEN